MRLASSCTVIASGITTSRTIFSCVGWKPCSWRCCFSRLRRDGGERALALALGRFKRVGDGQAAARRSPPGAALVRVGFGISSASDGARSARPGRSAVVVPASRRRVRAAGRPPRQAGGAPRPRRDGAPDPRTACAPLPRLGGAPPRRARAASRSSSSRRRRRFDSRRCWRSSASRTRASCSACARASRSSSVSVRSTTPPVRGARLRLRRGLGRFGDRAQADARLRRLRRLRRTLRRPAAASARFGGRGDAAALLLDDDGLRPAAGEALAHGVGVALQRKRLAR